MAPFFTLFGRTVGSYGLCSVFGLLVSSFVAIRLGRRQGFPIYPVIQAAVAALVGLLAGGHLLYGLLHLPRLLAQPAPIMFLRCFSGSVYYGGFLGAWFCVHWYAHRFAPNQCEPLTDLFACSVPLFHAFGRIGCFLGGCCYGIPCRWGFTAEGNPLVPEVNGVCRFPVQLLEAGCELGLLLLLLRLFRKGKYSGRLVACYLLGYSPLRFGLEFLRGDAARGVVFCLSASQWLSVLLFCTALWILRFKAPHDT